MTAATIAGAAPQQRAAMSPSKRAFDVVVGAVLCVITLPLLLALATWSGVRLRAWPFFVQERVGLGQQPIRIVKIRTLSPQTPAYLDKSELLEHGGEQRWAAALRKSHLDELPQFWQVVAGTLSLVGPRPMIASIVERMPAESACLRHSIRPGVTGPWQISVDGGSLLDDACDYDLAYVRRASARVDLSIIAWTTAQAVGASERSKAWVFNLMRVDIELPDGRCSDLVGVGNESDAGADETTHPASLHAS
ncbi:sugar transferase [Ilumatobacter fluminis]|uniref:sugar transferase n=1 Tax=Ilumatobacter fluminis TaxID=467091 RepID=UPI0014150F54|nr:sugar transferase [Ilumatobacter fluminis]